MRRLASIAFVLYLAGAGTSLIGFSALFAAYGVRQAVRAAPLPLHPWGTAAGLIAFPLGVLCLLIAQDRLPREDDGAFRAWQVREL